MGRRYGIGKYGRGTYDLGVNNIYFVGAFNVPINLSGRIILFPTQFEGVPIHFTINITGDEYIGPFWEPIGPISDFWQPVTEPPPQFRV